MSGFEAWAVRAGLAGGLVLLAGYSLAKLCRGPARRQAAAAWAVRGAVVAAVVAAFPGWLAVTLPAAAPPPVVEPPPAEVWADEPVSGFDVTADEVEAAPAAPAPAPVPPGWPAERWVFVGYAAVAGLLVGRLVLGHLALVRLTRRASPAPPRVTERFPGRVFVADRVPSPVCFGVIRPTVLLPRGLAERASVGELEWVLRHEADHIRRGDHRSNWWAAVAGCVFFPLPWYWAVRRELRLAQEYLADAAAAGDRPADYAAYLVHLSANPTRLPLLAAGVRAGRSDLSRRVTMLLSERTTGRAGRGWKLLVAGGAVAGAVTLGGLAVRADDPKPATITVRLTADDDKKPEEKKPAEERKTETRTITVRATASPEVAKLKAEIKAAAKKGDADAVAELVEKLEKALRSTSGTLTLNGRIEGGEGGGRSGPKAEGQRFEYQFFSLDKAIKELQAQLDGMKDVTPQAREAIEAALKSLKQQGQYLQGVQNYRWQPGQPAEVIFAPKPRFGAEVGAIPEAVREQLDLGEGVGLQVGEVREGTPAAAAGLKKGDILVRFGDTDVSSESGKFVEQVRGAKAGKTDVVVVRKGKKVTLTADLPEAAKPADAEGLKRRAEDQAKRAAESAKKLEGLKKYELRTRGGDPIDFRTLSVTVTDGKFTAKATNAGIEYQVDGKLVDGKAVPEEIVVKEGSQTHTGKAVKDLPENCRNAIERLLAKVTPPARK